MSAEPEGPWASPASDLKEKPKFLDAFHKRNDAKRPALLAIAVVVNGYLDAHFLCREFTLHQLDSIAVSLAIGYVVALGSLCAAWNLRKWGVLVCVSVQGLMLLVSLAGLNIQGIVIHSLRSAILL